MLHTLAIAWPGPFEMMLLAGLGLLIFGKRLPEVGRNIGKGIIEFKKGLKEAEESISADVSTPAPPPPQATLPPAQPQQPAQIAAEAPKYKFDPYTGKPMDEQATAPSHTTSA
jgi:sec-independent protein translocase protein TatA